MPAYLKRVFGEKAGFLCGWMQTVVFYPGLSAASVMGQLMIAVGGIVIVLLGLPVRAIFCKKK